MLIVGRLLKSFTALIAVVLLTAGCSSDKPVAPEEGPGAIRIANSDRTLTGIGAMLQLTAEYLNAQGSVISSAGLTTTWSSADEAVLTVDQAGTLTAVAEGVSTVTARGSGLQSSEQFTVEVEDVSITAFTGVSVLPMDGTGALTDQTVLVSGGQITAIGPTASISIPPEAEVVDGTDKYLTPGLTDAHTHPKDPEDLLPYLSSGVTTIISLGHNPAQTPVLQWRDQINEGALLGPTIYATREILDGANPRSAAIVVADPAAARAAVRDQVAAGVDFIKVYNSLTVPVFNAIMGEARARGVSVIGHGVRAPGLQGILDAGISAIAHGEELFYTHFGSTIDPSLIPSAVTAMADAGAWLMPNLSTFDRVDAQWGNTAALTRWLATPEARYLPPWHTTNWSRFHENNYANRSGSVTAINSFLSQIVGAMHDGGVPFLLSTDSPIIPGLFAGSSVHEDLRLLVEAGLTREEALKVGTANGGRFISEHRSGADTFGTVTVGARGDLLLLSGDPRANLGVLRAPDGVMVRGRYLTRSKLNQLLEELAVSWGR